MTDLKKVLSKIADLKTRLLKDSISPHFLGSILEEMLGYTWWTDSPGNFEVGSLKAGLLEVAQLIIRRLGGLDTDAVLTETDIVEKVTDNGDGTYTLSLREQWPGYYTAQVENNILRGYWQNLVPALQPGEGEQVLEDASARLSWMNVVSVDAARNEIVVTLYPDSQTPAGKNYPPVPSLKIARWGNSGYSENPLYAQRQNFLYLSSSDGNITKYCRVTKPVTDFSNIAASFGTFHDFLTGLDPRLNPGDDGIYADTVVARRIITIDSLARPVVTTIDRGPWKAGEKYYDGTVPNDNGVYERSLAWHAGHGWLCNSTGIADASNAPSWHSTWWTHAVGDKALHLEFEQVDSIVEPENPETPLSLRATYMGEDVTGSMAIYFDWTRRSWRNGTEDTASDALWNANNKNAGPSKTLTASDMNFQFGAPPEKLVITVTATLHDPSNPNLQPEAAQIYMI